MSWNAAHGDAAARENLSPPIPLDGSKMGLDASLWDDPTTGIGLYTRRLAQSMKQHGVAVRLLGARHSGDLPRGETSRTAFTLWRLPSVLRANGLELFHAVANFNLPLVRPPRTRFVLTVHDLIPLIFPHTVSVAYRWQFRLWLARSLKVTDHVICVSERTRTDLLQMFEFDPDRAVTIHNGVDHVDIKAEMDSAQLRFLESLNLPARFVLYGGALDARKNIGVLLRACVRLHRAGESLALVLVGQPWFGAGKLQSDIVEARESGLSVRVLGYQTESIFYELIRRASVFVFPSLYEGFGLPPLEALAVGCPVIASKAGALPETCGPAADYVDSKDELGFAEAIDRVTKLTLEQRASRIEQGKTWAGQFRWGETAKKTLDVYRDVLTHA